MSGQSDGLKVIATVFMVLSFITAMAMMVVGVWKHDWRMIAAGAWDTLSMIAVLLTE